jgi:hypothetical protein
MRTLKTSAPAAAGAGGEEVRALLLLRLYRLAVWLST